MSKQRERHQARIPLEEKVRQAVIGELAKADTVYVERSGFGAFDSILVLVSIQSVIPAKELDQVNGRIIERIDELLPQGELPSSCVQVQHNGETLFLRP